MAIRTVEQIEGSNIRIVREHCESCGNARTCKDGLCHECAQAEREAERCAICDREQFDCECDGGPWVTNGLRGRV